MGVGTTEGDSRMGGKVPRKCSLTVHSSVSFGAEIGRGKAKAVAKNCVSASSGCLARKNRPQKGPKHSGAVLRAWHDGQRHGPGCRDLSLANVHLSDSLWKWREVFFEKRECQ